MLFPNLSLDLQGLEGVSTMHADMMANELLDVLSAKLSSVSGHREKFRTNKLVTNCKPTLEDVTDRSFFGNHQMCYPL
jgi:hypothetical protein